MLSYDNNFAKPKIL